MENLRPPVLKRKFLINQGLQARIILQSSYVMLVSFGFTFIMMQAIDGYPAFGIGGTGAIIICIVSMVAGVLLSGAMLSHSIAGPVFHLENDMKAILDGKKSEPLRFRKSDHFQSLSQTYNQLTDHLRSSTESRSVSLEQIKK